MKRWTVSLPNPDGYVIQPRDTTFYSPKEIVLAADHDAEIERLRDELAECERVGGKFIEEIERLLQRLIDVGISTGSDDETCSHRHPRG